MKVDFSKEVLSSIVLTVIASLLYLASSLISGSITLSSLGMFLIQYLVVFLIVDLVIVLANVKINVAWRYLINGVSAFLVVGILSSGLAYISLATLISALVFTFIYLGVLYVLQTFKINALGFNTNDYCSI